MLIKNAILTYKMQVVCRWDLLYMKCVYGICGLSFSQEQVLPTPVSWLALDKPFCRDFKSYFQKLNVVLPDRSEGIKCVL